MKRNVQKFLASLLVSSVTAFRLVAAEPAPTPAPADAEVAYTKAIEKRVADILAILDLTDPTKFKNTHDILIAQYRTLRDWHEVNDAKRKSAKGPEADGFKASLKVVHQKFIASLSAELTTEQLEKVKDKMTYGKVQFTYTGYLNEYPTLSEAQKQKVLELLQLAREEAMDAGSSDEKSAVFNRYKGKINNYLSTQGVGNPRKKKPTPVSTNSPAAH